MAEKRADARRLPNASTVPPPDAEVPGPEVPTAAGTASPVQQTVQQTVQHVGVDVPSWTRRWPWCAVTSIVVASIVVASIVVMTIVVVVHPGPLPGEVGYVRALQRLGPPVPWVARRVRAWTTTELDVVVLALAAPWLAWRWRRRAAGALAIALLAMLVAQPLFKDVVDRPRPSAGQVDVRAVHTSESFPSGHALSTTAVWGVGVGLAARARRRGLAVAAAVPVALTALASGVQGVHWPSDAIAGVLVGALAARGAVVALGPPVRRDPSPTSSA